MGFVVADSQAAGADRPREQRRHPRRGRLLGGLPGEAGNWLQRALEGGVNHLGIAPQYGAAEAVVGPHLAGRRGGGVCRRQNAAGQPGRGTGHSTPPGRLLHADVLDLYQAHGVTTRTNWTGARGPSRKSSTQGGVGGVCRDHRSRHGRARGVPGGPPSLRPRHGDVPRLPGTVGNAEYSRAGRGIS